MTLLVIRFFFQESASPSVYQTEPTLKTIMCWTYLMIIFTLKVIQIKDFCCCYYLILLKIVLTITLQFALYDNRYVNNKINSLNLKTWIKHIRFLILMYSLWFHLANWLKIEVISFVVVLDLEAPPQWPLHNLLARWADTVLNSTFQPSTRE